MGISNSRFAQGAQVVHRAEPGFSDPVLHDEHMPVRVGNIISPAWLADQMGLPVADVQERLAEAEKGSSDEQYQNHAAV